MIVIDNHNHKLTESMPPIIIFPLNDSSFIVTQIRSVQLQQNKAAHMVTLPV